MGERGPKPLPSNIHILQGNRSKLPAHKLSDVIQPDINIPECPEHLSERAKQEWQRIAPELEKLGLISNIDRTALAIYCHAYARWVDAEEKLKALGDRGLIDTTPSGYKQIGVWYQISKSAVEQMHKSMGDFGMTPSSRTRVTPSPQMDLFGKDEQSGQTTSRFFR